MQLFSYILQNALTSVAVDTVQCSIDLYEVSSTAWIVQCKMGCPVVRVMSYSVVWTTQCSIGAVLTAQCKMDCLCGMDCSVQYGLFSAI